ncbi:MAG: SUMF1/EgtB/PvdO family nonheme iron enzyme [Alkalispirochaeta sp.]
MAARWKQIQSEEEIAELSVTLKPHLGVSPHVYVPVLWGATVIAVLLALLVMPGLRRPGEEVTITSVPEGAEIVVDGTFQGTTPATLFLPQGDREIVITAGTAREEITATIDRRLVGSLLFPKRREYTAVLSDADVAATVTTGIEEFAEWSLMGEPSEQFQYAPVGHDTARRLWTALGALDNGPPEGHDELTRFRTDLVAHAGTWQVRDLSAALVRTSNPGAVVTPGSLGDLVQFFVQLDNDSPAFARLVWGLAPAEEVFRAPLTDSVWAESRLDALSTALLAGSLAPDERAIPSSRTIEAQELRFVRVPEGSYILGYPLREETERGLPVQFERPFWIQDRELTRRDFARFLRDAPRWAPENKDDLEAEGVVQGEYLADWPEDWETVLFRDDEGAEPLRYVSWYAIEAFVRWMNASEVDGVPGVPNARFALPSAAQWEYAAFLNGLGDAEVISGGGSPLAVGSRTAGALAAHDLPGNLWEWTADWHANQYWAVAPSTGDQRIVAGGSFATGETGHNLLGAQPPEWTTPFLGARLVIVGEESEVATNGR